MFSHIKEVADRAESVAVGGGVDDVLRVLREMSLDDFGELLLNMPNSEFPRLSAILPAMASDEIQVNWTGNSGYALLKQSLTFVRNVYHGYEQLAGKPLDAADVLDYGCGYGRLLRLMLYFCSPDRLAGCDPWDKSIALCEEARIPAHLRVSDYLPDSLPFDGRHFDLVYAFSVFTHTSERATKCALSALHKAAKDSGVLVVTIRPKEYWHCDVHVDPDDARRLIELHDKDGFAFQPHIRGEVDGDVTYGDTSISINRFAALAEGWEIVKLDRTLDDPYQRIVYLRKK